MKTTAYINEFLKTYHHIEIDQHYENNETQSKDVEVNIWFLGLFNQL